MYQIESIHDERFFAYSFSSDRESFVGIFITDSEKESFGRFKPETRQLLLERYLEGVGNGLADGSDELFQYLIEGLPVPPSRTNILCEERGGTTSLKLGNVSIGEIAYQKPEIIHDIPKEQEKTEEPEPEEKIEIEEKEIEEIQENEEQVIKDNEDNKINVRQPWWNISRPVFILLILLLAAVAFFVTLLLTGKISLGNKGGNTPRTEQTDSTQGGGVRSDTTTSKLTKEQIQELAKYKEGLARVRGADGLYGFADKAGKIVIPCQWVDAHSFHQGLAVVKDRSGLWGYIDKKGKLAIPCKWKEASDFDASGTASVVNKYNEHFKIDKVGAIMRNTDNPKNNQH